MDLYPHYISIDFGTSYTSAAYWDTSKQKAVPVRFSDNDQFKIPSVVFFPPTGGIVIGQRAKKQLLDSIFYPQEEKKIIQDRIVSSIKSRINPNELIFISESESIEIIEIVAEIFRFVKEDIENNHLHLKVQNLVLTHPVVGRSTGFSNIQKDLLIKAAEKTGFNNIITIEEPIAASMSYDGAGQSIIIYDLGGGTLDLAFLKHSEDEIPQVIKIDGLSNCAGDAIDQVIYDFIDAEVEKKYQKNVSENEEIDLLFLDLCRGYKERSSRLIRMNKEVQNFKEDHYPLTNSDTVNIDISINKKIFNDITGKIIDKTISPLKTMQEFANSQDIIIDAVVLIGGSSRFPLVEEDIEKNFPNRVYPSQEYDIAVAIGAAIYGEKRRLANTLKDDIVFEETFEETLASFKKNYSIGLFNTLYNFAKRGHSKAMYIVGLTLFEGKVVQKNSFEAIDWMQRAAENGNESAQVFLGNCFFTGSGVDLDYEKSFELFKKAAESKLPEAFLGLANCFFHGKGTDKNIEESIRYYKKAGELGLKGVQGQFIRNIFEFTFTPGLYYKISPHIPESILEKCHSIYSNEINEIVMIYSHSRGLSIPTSTGIVFGVNGIAWNYQEYPYNINYISWKDIEIEGIQLIKKNRIRLSNSIEISQLPILFDRDLDETFEKFKMAFSYIRLFFQE